MLFDRYINKSKSVTTLPNEKKKSSLANSLFKRFPINLTSNKKKNNQSKIDNVNKPRPSLSLPNIHTEVPHTPIKLIEPSLVSSKPTIKQRKRHSAEQRRRRHHLISIQDANRHSFTFGHLPSQSTTKRLTKAELYLDQDQLAKLNKLTELKDNTEDLLMKLGKCQPPILVPHRSISHQLLTVPQPDRLHQQHRQSLSRAHSESHAKTVEREADPIEPKELAELLRIEQEGIGDVILIDVRNLIDYQKRRIKGSLNVNLPSLLIKRYQRGTVSNFNLENFITTFEGREIYSTKKSNDFKQKPTTFSTILEQKAVEAELKAKKNGPIWVVYDQDMAEDDQTSQAWTLLKVLERFIGSDKKKNEGKVFYLSGGFSAFEAEYEIWIESSVSNLPSLPIIQPASLQPSPSSSSAGTLKLNPLPRRSISYTMGESKNDLNKRTSLFSLDTHAARVSNANALARRANRRSQQQQLMNDNQPVQSQQHQQQQNSQQLHHQNSIKDSKISQPTLNQLAEDDEFVMTDISPRTETDFNFTISEVIPGFLFVGPEIETPDQSLQLVQDRQIKRVLNMAEECHDEGLSKQSIIYHKIAARDTLEMKNIELVMMEAVQFIEDAKKNHEPIYVHCKAGKSRSITAILAYLVTSERWTLKKAYQHVIKVRPNMSPNIGFISELMKMEGKVHGRVSSFLESDWQSTSLSSPELKNELNQLEKAWRTAETTV